MCIMWRPARQHFRRRWFLFAEAARPVFGGFASKRNNVFFMSNGHHGSANKINQKSEEMTNIKWWEGGDPATNRLRLSRDLSEHLHCLSRWKSTPLWEWTQKRCRCASSSFRLWWVSEVLTEKSSVSLEPVTGVTKQRYQFIWYTCLI